MPYIYEFGNYELLTVGLLSNLLADFYLQMADFVSSDNDAWEAASVFNDGNTVDFLKSLVNHAGSPDICKACKSQKKFN